jgi:hypothetical protein
MKITAAATRELARLETRKADLERRMRTAYILAHETGDYAIWFTLQAERQGILHAILRLRCR